VSKAEWLAKVQADLKGASLDRLRSRAPGGLELQPLYTSEDVPSATSSGFPGLFPFVRGATPVAGWLIRQEYADPRPDVCKAQIEEDLGRGVEALWIEAGPRTGCRVLTVPDLDAVLNSVDLAATSVCLEGGADTMALAAGFLAVAKARGVDYAALRGGFAFDPIGLLVGEGRIQGGLSARLGQLRDLAGWCDSHAPNLRAVWVSGQSYDAAGASTVQELAYTIATGIEYLREMTAAGLSIDAAARQIGFSYSISGNFFTQIAKLRAARALWANVVRASGGEAASAAMPIHARTSRFTKTQRDPWVNMLRATAECTAAVFGGAQSVSTLPFDSVLGTPDELARRVARNMQVVLREESHLDAVADPAGGSWFVESLTEELARAAWAEVQSVDAAGGIVKALGSGKLIDSVAEVAAVRKKALATRKTPIVGVSEFPNAEEKSLDRERLGEDEVRRMLRSAVDELDVGAHRDDLLGLARRANDPERELGALTEACLVTTTGGLDMYSVAAVLQHGQPEFHVEPLPQWRASEAWEQLRARSEESEARPVAFMANLGAIPSHKARSTWARNLLAAAGIHSTDNDGFTDADSIASAWSESGASLAVVCGSDADYESMLEPAILALKRANCPLVLVAGRPGEPEATLREAGASDFIYVGADVLSTMSNVLDSIGVER
jgi:methylmalonyl-CoA mutase